MFESCEELTARLTATGYFIDPVMIKVVYLATRMQKPLLLEGPAGSGRSTLARLLVRAADPDGGRILLEERRLSCYTLASLRSAVCFVPQHPVLFEGSVRDNLLYGNPRATTTEMDQVIQTAQLATVWGGPLG